MERLPQMLLDPASYPEATRNVTMIQTHTSWIFLTGKYAYKVKKPVNFGFLDYSTLEERRRFCHEELRLNRRLCPWLYLDVLPVSQTEQGLRIGGTGPVADYAVKMRELPQDSIMTSKLLRGEIGLETMEEMAEIIARFHAGAASGEDVSRFGRMETIKYNWEENFAQTEEFVGPLLERAVYERTKRDVERFMAEREEVFERRVAEGMVRWGHGDLHSGNIFLAKKICIFDCIEFNQRFSCSDVSCEIAFLLMDLEYHGAKNLGDHFLYRYVERSADPGLLQLLDFYMSYRAYVRSKVMAFKSRADGIGGSEKRESESAARDYLSLSQRYAGSLFAPVSLSVVYGLPGVGKTCVAQELAGLRNAVHLRTDILRKELASVPLSDHRHSEFGGGIYSGSMSEETYARLLEVAHSMVVNGKSCVLDGTFSSKHWRVKVRDLAESLSIPFLSIYCECPEEVVLRRLASRRGDVSDATKETYRSMKMTFERRESDSVIVDTSAKVDSQLRALLSRLGERLPDQP